MFRRIINLIKGFLSLLISSMEKRNLEALIALEKENLRKHVAIANECLVSLTVLSEHLLSQVKQLESEEWDLRAKIAANLKANQRQIAGQYALRLQVVDQQLSESRVQLNMIEATYKQLSDAHEQAVKLAGKALISAKTFFKSTGEAERAALAEVALAKFIAQEGLEMPRAIEAPKVQVSDSETGETIEATIVNREDPPTNNPV